MNQDSEEYDCMTDLTLVPLMLAGEIEIPWTQEIAKEMNDW
jgi:hypothetical protein